MVLERARVARGLREAVVEGALGPADVGHRPPQLLERILRKLLAAMRSVNFLEVGHQLFEFLLVYFVVEDFGARRTA